MACCACYVNEIATAQQSPTAPSSLHTYLQGQVAVRINRTRMEWLTATNPPTVHNYTVRLEQIVSSKAQLVATATVPAANAGRDVVFGGLQAGRYRVGGSVDVAGTGYFMCKR